MILLFLRRLFMGSTWNINADRGTSPFLELVEKEKGTWYLVESRLFIVSREKRPPPEKFILIRAFVEVLYGTAHGVRSTVFRGFRRQAWKKKSEEGKRRRRRRKQISWKKTKS